jgi:Tol biopolymer transport system component
MMRSARRPALLVLLVITGGGFGCGQGKDLVGPASGVLRIISADADGVGDSDGLIVTIGDADRMPLGLGDTLEMVLGPGPHTVFLSGIPADCGVDGDNPRPVRIFQDDTTVVEFRVVCAPPHGTLVITTTTSGTALDPDGFTVAADPAAAVPVGLNDRVVISDLIEGEHLLRLSGVAGNCSVAEENPRSVQVPVADTASAAFSITCRPPPSGRIAFGRNLELFVMEADATNLVNLSLEYELRGSPLEFTGGPTWSTDGRLVAFESDKGITVVDADPVSGSPSPNRLTSNPGDNCPDWSPDGTTVVFKGDTTIADASQTTIRTVEVGTGLQNTLFVSSESLSIESCPVWSPDGRQIAFATRSSTDVSVADVVAVDAAGGPPTSLADGLPGRSVTDVSWSPDGTHLAIAADRSPTDFGQEIFVLDLATGMLLDVTRERLEFPIEPTWSPDGFRIVFAEFGSACSDFCLFRLNADGSGLVQLTFPPEDSDDRQPAWGPSP